MALCECGCGREVKPGDRFIHGHHRRGVNLSDETKEKIRRSHVDKKHTVTAKERMSQAARRPDVVEKRWAKRRANKKEKPTKLCECGCGEFANYGRRFVAGHQNRKPPKSTQLCECGCGGETMPGKRFIHGHNGRGGTHTRETAEKIRQALFGNTNGAGHTWSDEAKERMRQSKLGEKNPMYGKTVSADTRAAMGAASSARKHTEESKRKLSIAHRGDKNPAWKGGISQSAYCQLFDRDLKTVVRDYFNNCCFISGITTKENGKNLSVHHVGYDKRCLCSSPAWCVFVPLSASHHSKTNKDRWSWYEYLMCQIALRNPNYYAYHVPVVFYDAPSYNFGYVFEKHRVGKLLHQK